MQERSSINSLIGKKIKDVSIDPGGHVVFTLTKKQKIVVPYPTIYDRNGNFYNFDEIKFSDRDKN